MTPLEMIAEWRRGCSCSLTGDPYECRECTVGLIEALERAVQLRPIESAPKDGTLVLLYWEDQIRRPWESEGGYCVGFWSDPEVGDTLPEDAGWYATDTSGNTFHYPPTHWAPLPVLAKPAPSVTMSISDWPLTTNELMK